MNTQLTRIATMVLANLLIGAAVTPTEAQQAVPAILFNQNNLGIDYVVRPLSNGENYIKITGILMMRDPKLHICFPACVASAKTRIRKQTGWDRLPLLIGC